MSLKLFYSPGACSLAPHILLCEAGLDFEANKVDLREKRWSGGDYKAVNPKGQVPALQLANGDVLTENAVVQQYIAERAPQSGLLPKAGTDERWHALEWLNYVATELHKGYGPLWGAGPEDAKDAARAALKKKFAYVAERLKGRDYLMGSAFTAPDAYLFVMLSWAQHHKIDLSEHPILASYMRRVAERPGARKALVAEGLAH